jgi:hypothetical protein
MHRRRRVRAVDTTCPSCQLCTASRAPPSSLDSRPKCRVSCPLCELHLLRNGNMLVLACHGWLLVLNNRKLPSIRLADA